MRVTRALKPHPTKRVGAGQAHTSAPSADTNKSDMSGAPPKKRRAGRHRTEEDRADETGGGGQTEA